MSCTVEDELTAYVDAELSAVEEARVRTHLLGCPSCRTTEALLRRAVDTLAALPAFEPSLGLRRRVLQRLEGLPPPLRARVSALFSPRLLVPSTVGLLAAAALAVAVVGPLRHPAVPEALADGAALDVAMNFEVLRDYQVLGLERPEDVEVVAQLEELERSR